MATSFGAEARCANIAAPMWDREETECHHPNDPSSIRCIESACSH